MRPLALLAVTALLTGCATPAAEQALGLASAEGADVTALRVPQTDFYDAPGDPNTRRTQSGGEPFHTLEEIEERLAEWNATYPDLVEVREIGRSREDRPIRLVVLTNEAVPGPKPAPLFDGGHHANELAGVEHALYVVDYLLENRATNATVRDTLDRLEIHVVPLVNPDGYVRQTRGNALGVNLNRNYDIDWGNPMGASNGVMGTLAHATGEPMPSVAIVAENSGPHPFSEPESVAMRDLMESLDGRMAFYLTMHTPTNGFIAPWAAADAPRQLAHAEDDVFESVLAWVRENTEYEAGKAQWGNFSAGLPYAASGSSMDWAFLQHRAPAFTLEIEIWYTSVTSADYADRGAGMLGPYDGLRYWMEASLPVSMYLLANAEALAAWEPPTAEPPLPEGVPPPVPEGAVRVEQPFHI